MHVLAPQARVAVLRALVEGCSIRTVARMTGHHIVTILRLLVLIGEGCERLHNRLVRDLVCTVIQVDEIWSYIGKKQRRVTDADPVEFGDAYTFVALAAASKLVINYSVGKRDQLATDSFIADLRSRLLVVPQITSDGFSPYVSAIENSFGGSVDYGQIVKHYRRGGRRDDDHRYEPPRDPFITKSIVTGSPNVDKMSTSYVERQNLTMRMHIRRLTRLCNGFSKKIENHRAAMALHFAFYNFCRIHETIRCTPAIEAQITDHVWTLEELLDAVLAEGESAPPIPKPLALPNGITGARELPGGRGWLRVVK